MIDTIKKTRTELENLYGLFTSLKDEKFNPKFSFFILRNLGLLEGEVTALNETRAKLHDSIKEYDAERVELAAKMADTDDSGNPIVDNGSYKIIENYTSFQAELVALQEKHKEAVADFQVIESDIQELLGETIDQSVMKVSYNDIPSETFSITQLFLFKDFFKETDEELDELIMG